MTGHLWLHPLTESAREARAYARAELVDSSCDVDTVLLLVSEVVTNAVLHARTRVTLTVRDRGSTARIEVADGSPTLPSVHTFPVDSATGRGLRMLDRLAEQWGVDLAEDGQGKVVWFEVGRPSEDAWESFTDALCLEGL